MTINKGEVRQVGIEVVSQLAQDFIIETADYRILKKDGTEIENGISTIDEHKILTIFSAATLDPGQYYCEFTYRIGPEILKAKICVEVI